MTRTDRTLLGVLALVGLIVHGWFVLGAAALDTDRALILLMARRFAEGAFSPYFWAQNYMGALEPLLLAPLARVGRATPVGAGLVALTLTAALAALSVRLARRAGGSAWMALLVWAVPPAVVVHHHVSLYGARLAATLLMVAALAWALGARSRWGWAGVGVLTGVAWYGDHLMLPWVVGVAWIAVARGGLLAMTAAALPVVAMDTAAAMATPAFHLSGPNDPGSWIGNVWTLLGRALPRLLGLLPAPGPGPVFEVGAPSTPEAGPWILLVLPGAAGVAAVVWTWVRDGRRLLGGEGAPLAIPSGGDEAGGAGPAGPPLVLQALLLVCGAGVALFLIVGGGGDRWPTRYLVLLWPALSILASVAVARWPSRTRPLAAVVVLPALHTLLVAGGWPPRGGDGEAARAEAVEVEEALVSAGVEAVAANYWDAYRLALLTGTPRPWVPLTIIERRPDCREAARAARPVGYLLRAGDTRVKTLLEEAPGRHGIDVRPVAEPGRFRLWVADAWVPGLIEMNVAPPRGWQRLAALAAGLLVPGALAGVWGLAWATRRPPRERHPDL